VIYNRRSFGNDFGVDANLNGKNFNGIDSGKYTDSENPETLNSIPEVKSWNLCVRAVEKASSDPLHDVLLFHSYSQTPDLPTSAQYNPTEYFAFRVEVPPPSNFYFGLRKLKEGEKSQKPIKLQKGSKNQKGTDDKKIEKAAAIDDEKKSR